MAWWHGHPTIRINVPVLAPYRVAANKVLPSSLVEEFAAFLRILPTPPPQHAARGRTADQRTWAILSHIARQKGTTAASRCILAATCAALVFNTGSSSLSLRENLVGRSIYTQLRSEPPIMLPGRVLRRPKITLQGKCIKLRLARIVEPYLQLWLRDGGAAAIRQSIIIPAPRPKQTRRKVF